MTPDFTDRQDWLIDKLKTDVIGQDEALRTVASFMHLNNVWLEKDLGTKVTLLLYGNTGCGKTYLIQKLVEVLQANYVYLDSNQFEIPGWHGYDDFIHNIKEQLSGCRPGPDENGYEHYTIFCIDEIDKMLFTGSNSDGGHNYNKLKQASLLTFLEGTVLPRLGFNTERVIFILVGSFMEFKRDDKEIGFSATINSDGFNKPLDLEKLGIMSELAGRIHIKAKLHDLSLEKLKEIALKPFGIVNQIEEAIEDRLTEEEIDILCQKALKEKKGARGLITSFVQEFMDLSAGRKVRKTSQELYEEELERNPWALRLD